MRFCFAQRDKKLLDHLAGNRVALFGTIQHNRARSAIDLAFDRGAGYLAEVVFSLHLSAPANSRA